MDDSNKSELQFYNLRSRKVIFTKPPPYKEVQKRKKEQMLQFKNSKKFCNQSADPDSGFAESYDSASSPEIVNNVHWKKALNWVEKRRDTGLFIECCNLNCKKYRYCEDYHDPIDVPELWFCHDLGDDVTCETPEDKLPRYIEDDLIENQYTAGSIVWGQWFGYPWWPAMVCDSPETLSYYLLKLPSRVPIKYHVIYFSNTGKIERSWLTPKKLKPFVKNSMEKICKRTVYRGVDYTEEVKTAYDIAMAILENKLTISERLAGYSFLSFYGGYSPSVNHSLRSFRSSETISTYRSYFLSPKSQKDWVPGTPQKTPKYKKYITKKAKRNLKF